MRAFLPALLLVLTALHHRWRTRTVRQSAWKGGGFAMFSDMVRTALIPELIFQVQGESRRVRIPPPEQYDIVTIIPTISRIDSFRRDLARQMWRLCGDSAHPVDGAPTGMEVTDVCIQHVWVDFDCRTGIYSGTVIATYQ
jgi:hypothetical protein